MRLTSIASGSSGNCIFVSSGKSRFLVDTGISAKRIEQGLSELGEDASKLDGILITHEHIDHIGGLGVMMRRHKLPVFATAGTIDCILQTKKLGEMDRSLFYAVTPDVPFQIKDLVIDPSSTWHDAKDPVCYSFYSEGVKASVATDLGNFDDYLVEKLSGSDILFVEANHDVKMLEVGKYPYPLKQRILGSRGHLSNERSGQLLSRLVCDRLKNIYLGHLSKDNNYPDLAYETVKLELLLHNIDLNKLNIHMEVAKRDTLSTLCQVS
ncbi:MAG: MBL fold metallo-hydrolase [Lachnospiraceae bacterium]|nr:MBL fold metallo-hydrolase [Lachnospiraceae bacterium]